MSTIGSSWAPRRRRQSSQDFFLDGPTDCQDSAGAPVEEEDVDEPLRRLLALRAHPGRQERGARQTVSEEEDGVVVEDAREPLPQHEAGLFRAEAARAI